MGDIACDSVTLVGAVIPDQGHNVHIQRSILDVVHSGTVAAAAARAFAKCDCLIRVLVTAIGERLCYMQSHPRQRKPAWS